MRLTLHTDYALRVLIYAALKADAVVTIGDIIADFDLSNKGHIMKVVHQLGQKGYLETMRGNRGGMRLARKPNQISVGAVIRDMEEQLGVVGCLRGTRGYCRIEECCVLRNALRDATNAFLAMLDRYSIEDLAKPRRDLAQSLNLQARL